MSVSTFKMSILCVVSVALLACASSAAVAEPSDPTHCHQSSGRLPISVEWVSAPEKVSAGDEITLEAQLSWLWPLDNGFSAALLLPAGVVLVEGDTKHTIAPQATPGAHKLSWRVKLDQIPTEDLIVQISMSGGWWGYHKDLTYRFGRPEPVLTVERTGPEVIFNGRSYGKGVPLSAPTSPPSKPNP